MTTQILIRRDSEADWTTNDPVLGEGEIGISLDVDNFKVGDGVSAWSGLTYYLPTSTVLTTATSLAGDASGLYNALVVAQASGAFALPGDATITSTGTLNDYAVGAVTLVRWNGASALTLTGIANGADGRLLLLENVTAAQFLTLSHDATSSAANRFYAPNAKDVLLVPHAAVLLRYDATDSRWVVAGTGTHTGANPSIRGDVTLAAGTDISLGQSNGTITITSTAGGGGGGQAFPIGGVYINVTGVNPATELGYGTWSALGAGKTLVGYDSADTDFDTAEETGGAKTVAVASHGTLTHDSTGTSGSHTHSFSDTSSSPSGTTDKTGGGGATATSTHTHTISGTTGAASTTHAHTGSSSHGTLTHTTSSVVQPYIVVHIWKRTA